jgi:hypothetical protein
VSRLVLAYVSFNEANKAVKRRKVRNNKYLVENSFMISFATTMKMIKHTKKNGKQSHREG